MVNNIKAKNILQTQKNGDKWFGIDYNMNIYRGCNHGCIYCDSRSDCYKNINFEEVKIKKDAISILENELASKRKKGVVATGSMSDPYNKYEEKYELTRQALKLLKNYGFGVSVFTKSNLITRDIDVFKEIALDNPVLCAITITTVDDKLAKSIEPNVCSSSERFMAVKQLNEAGVYTGVIVMPVLPYITDSKENLIGLVKKAKESGAKFIYFGLGVTLRDTQRLYYYSKIEEMRSGLTWKYIKSFGNNYFAYLPQYKELWECVKKECEKKDIIYRPKEIFEDYKKPYILKQLSLFEF